jgi:hypothetical protein
MTQKFAIAARSALMANIGASDTILLVDLSVADLFPVADTGTDPVPTVGKDWFKIILENSSHQIEVVYVRTRTLGSAAMTNLLRGQEGTTARAFLAGGSIVGLRHTAVDLQDAISFASGATSFWRNLVGASSAALSRAGLGAGATGDALFQASDAGTARTAIGAVSTEEAQEEAYSIATVGGTADALTLSFTPALTALHGGIFQFVAASDNATTTPTGNLDGLGAKTFIKGNNLALAAGDIKSGMTMLARYDSVLGKLALLNPANGISNVSTVLQGYFNGFTMSTAGSSATFAVAAGQATDSGNAALITLPSAISKTTAAWAVGSGNGGLDTGTIAANTPYHRFVIRRPDTGVVDVLFSLSATAPTLPANYTQFRWIGAWWTDGSSQWEAMIQVGRIFRRKVPSLDASNVSLSATYANLTLRVPTGIRVIARGNNKAPPSSNQLQIRPTDCSDGTPSASASPLSVNWVDSLSSAMGWECLTDTSARIAWAASGSGSGWFLTVEGWTDFP